MLGKEYFEKRLGDIYDYSHIGYIAGKGTCGRRKEYDWELCVDVCGEVILVLTPTCHLGLVEKLLINDFSGKSSDEEWEVSCNRLSVSKTVYQMSSANSTGTDSSREKLFCELWQPFSMKRGKRKGSITSARGYFRNLDFTRENLERGFSAELDKKTWYFQTLEHRSTLIELIDIGRISGALLSYVTIPLQEGENIDSIEDELSSVSWFLSFLRLNLVSVPVVEYWSDGTILAYSITSRGKSDLQSTNAVVDNLRIDGGIRYALEEGYSKYKELRLNIGFDVVFDLLSEIERQKYIELKLGLLIVAYEHLTLKYLLDQGMHEEKIGDNIHKKLAQVNKYLRFIPSEMMGDDIRGKVRNPLFHSGEIPLLKFDEKLAFFKRYHDLLICMILKILGYTGKYISRVKGYPISVEDKIE